VADILDVLATPIEALRNRDLQPIEVAVLDSGMDASHGDLRGRVVAAFGVGGSGDEVEMVEADVCGNRDQFGHGTAVGSIIAAIAPNARLVDIRILDAENESSGSMLLAGFRLALTRRSPIVNLSLAATARFSGPLRELCEIAYRQRQLVVAAKRNAGYPDLGFPAELSPTVSVDRSGIDSIFHIAFRGSPIEFAGRGDDVVCAAPGGGYTTKTGTSFATPTVAALCALLLGAYPDLTAFEIKSVLKAMAERPRR
jgi:subtilisin family serine protease